MSSADDSAESHSECRKGRKDIWNIHKKTKENSKGIGKGTKKPPYLATGAAFQL